MTGFSNETAFPAQLRELWDGRSLAKPKTLITAEG